MNLVIHFRSNTHGFQIRCNIGCLEYIRIARITFILLLFRHKKDIKGGINPSLSLFRLYDDECDSGESIGTSPPLLFRYTENMTRNDHTNLSDLTSISTEKIKESYTKYDDVTRVTHL